MQYFTQKRHSPWNRGRPFGRSARRGIGGAAALLTVILTALISGCSENKNPPAPAISNVPTVRLAKPERRNIEYSIEQPGFVEAYEQTSIYAKVTGFIQHFYVDIGDQVKKGDVLAEIFVPELREEHDQKAAQVVWDTKHVEMVKAQVEEAKANVAKAEAEVVRWDSELKRLEQIGGVIDKQVVTETQREVASTKATKAAAVASVAAREADVVTAEAKIKVDEADERRVAALLAYTKVTAPYDGVVTVRNANTGDFVQAASGDKSTAAPSPMFVVARTDMLRIFVDVPESYARYVRAGTEAMIRTEALSGQQIPAKVTRTSWAIRQRTRTLWTEIDLSAKEYDGLRPGMYVYTKVRVQREGVFALPQQALMVSGNETYCFLLESDKAVKTPIERGLSDGTWTEVTKMKIDDPWVAASGKEQVILGDLSELTDGQTVDVAKTAKNKEQ